MKIGDSRSLISLVLLQPLVMLHFVRSLNPAIDSASVAILEPSSKSLTAMTIGITLPGEPPR